MLLQCSNDQKSLIMSFTPGDLGDIYFSISISASVYLST